MVPRIPKLDAAAIRPHVYKTRSRVASRHGCWDGVLQLSDLPRHPAQGPSSSSSSRWAGSWSCVPRVLPASGVLPFSPAAFWQGGVSGESGCGECWLPRAQLGVPKGPRRTRRRAHVALPEVSAAPPPPSPCQKGCTNVLPVCLLSCHAPGAVSNSPAAGGLGDVEINLLDSVPAAPRAGIANLRSSRGSHAGLCALNPHEMSRLSRETREAGAQGTGDWPCRVRAGVLLPWSSC